MKFPNSGYVSPVVLHSKFYVPSPLLIYDQFIQITINLFPQIKVLVVPFYDVIFSNDILLPSKDVSRL